MSDTGTGDVPAATVEATDVEAVEATADNRCNGGKPLCKGFMSGCSEAYNIQKISKQLLIEISVF